MNLKTVFIFALLFSAFSVHAADLTINGTVLEKGTRNPLQGVVVSVQDQAVLSAVSDAKGHFQITLPAAGSYILIASNSGITARLPVQLAEDKPLPAPTFYLRVPETLGEMVVTAERSQDKTSKAILTGDELRRAPGTMGDPLRAVQSLPGVAMGSDTSSAPAVRGSGPADNAYYADTLPIGQLFHSDGSSIFHASLINDFNLYSAAWSPQYADVVGGILDVSLRDPRKDRLGGEISASLLGASALLEGPVADNQSFYFAARRSYFDLLIGKQTHNGVTYQLPSYSDYQGKYLWHLNADQRLSLYVNGAKDSIAFSVSGNSDTALAQPVLVGDSNINTSYSTQALVLDSVLSGSAFNKLAVGQTDTKLQDKIGLAVTVDAEIKTSFLREQFNFQWLDNHDTLLSGNYQTVRANVNIDALHPTCTQFDPNCDLSTAPRVTLIDGIHYKPWDISARDRWLILPQLTLIGGVRQTHDNYLNKTYTEPRLGTEWAWSDRTLLTAGWGKHNESPSTEQILRNFGNPYLSHIEADHRVMGVTRKFDEGWSWKTEAYYKKISNLVINDPISKYINGGSGHAYGVEMLVKKARTDRLSGWFSLSLARSALHNDITGNSFIFSYDQPVNATLVGNYKMTENWSLGAKWTFHTGNPYTPVVGTNGTYADGRPVPAYGAINSQRLPNYHRLDLRLDRTYVYNKWKLTTFFEIINAYAHNNVAGYDYGPYYSKKDPIYQLPFLPTFGVQGEF